MASMAVWQGSKAVGGEKGGGPPVVPTSPPALFAVWHHAYRPIGCCCPIASAKNLPNSDVPFSRCSVLTGNWKDLPTLFM